MYVSRNDFVKIFKSQIKHQNALCDFKYIAEKFTLFLKLYKVKQSFNKHCEK